MKQKMKTDQPDDLGLQFISHRMRTYDVPQRKGTPKGEAIGLSQKKYEASLYTLYNPFVYGGLQGMAKFLEISYGLLKKWRSEKIFKETVIAHCREFAAILLQNLWQEQERASQEFDKYFNLPIEEMNKKEPPSSISIKDNPKFSHIKLYSTQVHEFICEEFISRLKLLADRVHHGSEEAYLDFFSMGATIVDFYSTLSPEDQKSEAAIESNMVRIVREMVQVARQVCYEGIEELLLKDSITMEDRKMALLELKILQRYV